MKSVIPPRRSLVSIVLTAKQKDRFRAVARSEGLTLSGWMRRLAMKAVEEATK